MKDSSRWRISCSRLLVLLFVVATYTVIQITALEIVARIDPYFAPRILGFADHLVALGCLLVPAAILPLRSSPAGCATWVFYTFVFVSACTAGISIAPSLDAFLPFIGFLTMAFTVFCLTARIRMPTLAGRLRGTRVDLLLLLAAVAVVVYAWSFSGFTIQVGLDDVYDRRLDVRATGNNWGYVVAPLRLLLPVLALYAWEVRRSFYWLVIMVVGSIAVFSYDGTKSVLLVPLFLWLMLKGLRSGKLPIVLLGTVVVLNLLAVGEYAGRGSTVLADYGIRRAFVGPGLIAYHYWDFAPDATSLRTLTFDIGRTYFGRDDINANSNLMMWGYVWARWAGGALIALIAGLLVAQFNVYPGRRYPELGALMAGGCAVFWSEQFLHTSMLSSGVLFVAAAAVIMRFMPAGFPSLRPRLTVTNLNERGVE